MEITINLNKLYALAVSYGRESGKAFERGNRKRGHDLLVQELTIADLIADLTAASSAEVDDVIETLKVV